MLTTKEFRMQRGCDVDYKDMLGVDNKGVQAAK